jgi:hypothetical protein
MYEQKVSTSNPGLIVGCFDNSGSTADNLAGTTDAIYMWIARYVGIILMELLSRCTSMQGQQAVIKPRYYNSFILYGSQPQVWHEPIMDIETTVTKYQQSDNTLGPGGSHGGTDTKAAFEKAYEILENAVQDNRFKNSFPPMLLHLTDGESQTDAQPIADKIKQLSTSDGNILVVNVFIGTDTNLEYSGPADFSGYLTASEAGCADNVRLFNMSSEMPETIYRNLVDDGIFPNLRQGSRLFFDVRTKEMLKHAIQVVGSIGSRTDRMER